MTTTASLSLSDVADEWRQSRDSKRREYAAVFDALSEAIREKLQQSYAHGDALSPTFYFAAVIAALNERTDANDHHDDRHQEQLNCINNHDDDDDDDGHRRQQRPLVLTRALLVWLTEVTNDASLAIIELTTLCCTGAATSRGGHCICEV